MKHSNKNHPISYCAFLILRAPFSLKMKISLIYNNTFTVSENCFLKPTSLKNHNDTIDKKIAYILVLVILVHINIVSLLMKINKFNCISIQIII